MTRTAAAPPPATTSSIPIALPALRLLAGLANILDGEHSNELSVLCDRQRPRATLLENAKTVLEKVSLGRDCGDIRLHQVTDARVPLRGVGCGHDLVAREHAH